jgi:hypothetical protein
VFGRYWRLGGAYEGDPAGLRRGYHIDRSANRPTHAGIHTADPVSAAIAEGRRHNNASRPTVAWIPVSRLHRTQGRPESPWFPGRFTFPVG